MVSTETFNYDAAGNVTSAPDSSFQYDTNNRLTSFNGSAVSYDLDGNMLSNGTLTCTYDSANRLISACGHTYTYNAEDVRIRNLCAEEDTTYTYNTNAKLSMLLMKTTNGVVTKYVYGRGLIGEEVGSVFKTYHFDCHGSTIAITNASGNITDTFAYDTYGKLLTRTGTNKVIFGYNGRDGVVTDDNGLIYMRARYYSPAMKRFINADVIVGTISNAVTLNRFAYANGNPVSLIDPFGLSPERGNQGHSSDYYNRAMWLDEKQHNSYQFAPTVLEAAYMAQHIYYIDEESSPYSYGKWELIDILVDDNGFRMGVYKKMSYGETLYTIVNKGSTTTNDWSDNFKQPFGKSEDMKASIEISQKFVKEHSYAHTTFVGHSKGGAEAAANAVATNKKAILFNPMIPNLALYGLNPNEYSSDMTSYVIEGEILNSVFGEVRVGNTEYLTIPQEYKIQSGDYFEKIKDKIIWAHDISTIINILD